MKKNNGTRETLVYFVRGAHQIHISDMMIRYALT